MEKEKKEKRIQFSAFDKVLLGIAVGLISFTTVNATASLIKTNKNYLKPFKQVERDAEFLEADLDIMRYYVSNPKCKEIIRLKHNEDEPIYISLDSSVKNEKIKNNIYKSLNYVEDVFSDINDKYKFKVVDEQTFQSKKEDGKTVIKYGVTNDFADGVLGTNGSISNKTKLNEIFGSANKNIYTVETSININEKELLSKYNDDQILYTLVHELLHSFGFGDIYNQKMNELTVMDVYYGFSTQLISPNDLRVLYSAYYEDHLTKDSIDYDKLEEVKKKIDVYENEYFDYVANKIMKNYLIADVVEMGKLNGSFKATLNNKSLNFTLDGDKAQIEVYNYKGQLQAKSNGVIQYGENYAILREFDIDIPEISQFYFALYKNSRGIYNIVKINSGALTQVNLTHSENEEMTK